MSKNQQPKINLENLMPKEEVVSNIDSDMEMCGIVMPISAMDGYSESHWLDVRKILENAIEKAGYNSRIVSESDEINVLQKNIVQNLYDNPIVVCDISGRNPNVMFELGLRLAFDKPTIIVKDNNTPYSFDTSVIEHLVYPKDLRYADIGRFMDKLTDKILQTVESHKRDPSNYSTYLKNFGTFKVPVLDESEVTVENYLLDEMKSIKNSLITLSRIISNSTENSLNENKDFRDIKRMYVESNVINYIIVILNSSYNIQAQEFRFLLLKQPWVERISKLSPNEESEARYRIYTVRDFNSLEIIDFFEKLNFKAELSETDRGRNKVYKVSN